ncbi:hypothetical protein [Mangrovibacterium diazotrophicum]|uniref:Outer membrane protein with beta-barrel domain n=1 Tax=Mangrovibacterium diazotrophicum TaxID=1261403 RepID=A0A419VUK4_9BACT|nr:hypothetical protein [Mangrovibacterium diazotrophicum]RKD85077.1 hypothetical protein BC643_4596 [Mangrovibacterium diazotrophicum]
MLLQKRFWQTCLLLVIGFNAWAQPTSKDWMLSVEGNYYKSNSDRSVSGSDITTDDKYWNLGLNAERFITDRFSVGVGLARYYEITKKASWTLEDDIMYGELIGGEGTYWLPRVFCKYYLPVFSRLYLVPRFTGSYGKAKLQGVGFYLAEHYPFEDGMYEIISPRGTSWSIDTKGEMLSLELAPELAYFPCKHWGLFACFGGLRYDRFMGDLTITERVLSFKREYWKLGVNFRF